MGIKGIRPTEHYTVRDVAAYLGLTEQTVRDYLAEGRLKGTKVGPTKRWLIPGRSILDLRKRWGMIDAPAPTRRSSRKRPKSLATELEQERIQITFDPSLSAEQVRGFLDALATYYRACGGAGLEIDLEFQELIVMEPENVFA